jgi:hypothetical protein
MAMDLDTKMIATGVALLGVLALSGCADQEESLIVLHSPAWNDDGECVVDAANDTALALGTLDLAPRTPYILPVILQNQLLSDATSSSGVDNGEMQLRGVDVRLSMDQAPEIIDALEAEDPALVDFTVPLPTVSLPPGGRQGVLVEVISRRAAELLNEQLGALDDGARPILSAQLVFHARRTGNAVGGIGEVDAREYIFPVQVCSGCLLTCQTCTDQQCPVNPQGVVGGVCGNAQDLPYAPSGCGSPLEGEG